MDDTQKQFATKDKFAAHSGDVRRWKPFDCPIVGPVWIRSLTAGEFARIDAARTRANMAAVMGKKEKEQIRALNDGLVELFVACVHDEQKAPMFTISDRSMLIGLDTAISQPLVLECATHCGLDEADLDVESAQKN